jgi:hypothetical protein
MHTHAYLEQLAFTMRSITSLLCISIVINATTLFLSTLESGPTSMRGEEVCESVRGREGERRGKCVSVRECVRGREKISTHSHIQTYKLHSPLITAVILFR